MSRSQTTILQCLLGELKPVEGTVEVKCRVSYASQEPWVFSGTLRDNILLGKTFEPDRYQSVLEACALDKAGTPNAQTICLDLCPVNSSVLLILWCSVERNVLFI